MFLRSDGKWAPIEGVSVADTHIINIYNESNKSHTEIIQEAVTNFAPEKGDLIIIIDKIIDDNEQRIAYTYNGSEWLALNSTIVTDK